MTCGKGDNNLKIHQQKDSEDILNFLIFFSLTSG